MTGQRYTRYRDLPLGTLVVSWFGRPVTGGYLQVGERIGTTGRGSSWVFQRLIVKSDEMRLTATEQAYTHELGWGDLPGPSPDYHICLPGTPEHIEAETILTMAALGADPREYARKIFPLSGKYSQP